MIGDSGTRLTTREKARRRLVCRLLNPSTQRPRTRSREKKEGFLLAKMDLGPLTIADARGRVQRNDLIRSKSDLVLNFLFR